MNFGTVCYLSSPPPAYHCTKCKAHGCKLWRQYQTCADAIDLLCGSCSLIDQKKQGPVDDDGTILDLVSNDRTDAIGWLVPAVPTEEGDTYWGYSGVPMTGVMWWKRLPTTLNIG